MVPTINCRYDTNQECTHNYLLPSKMADKISCQTIIACWKSGSNTPGSFAAPINIETCPKASHNPIMAKGLFGIESISLVTRPALHTKHSDHYQVLLIPVVGSRRTTHRHINAKSAGRIVWKPLDNIKKWNNTNRSCSRASLFTWTTSNLQDQRMLQQCCALYMSLAFVRWWGWGVIKQSNFTGILLLPSTHVKYVEIYGYVSKGLKLGKEEHKVLEGD